MPALPCPAPAATDSLLAMADRCVQCGLCLPHCPTYRLDASEAESPRGRIAYIKAVSSGFIEPTAVGDQHLDHCLGCRRCEAACPAEVPYEALLIQARQQQRQRQQLAMRRRWPLALLARPRLLHALIRLYRGLYPLLPGALRPLPRPLPETPSTAAPASGALALFAGCVARPYESASRVALVQLLAATGLTVSLPAGQSCCGTAASHAGERSQAEFLAGKNRRAFAGSREVLTLASGCHEALARSLGPGQKAMDALDFLASRENLLQFRSAKGRRVALHLPCSQRVNRGEAGLRLLLSRIPDLSLVELPDGGCCGAAGLHMLAEPDRGAALRAPLLQALAESGATELLSANIGCRLHLAQGTVLPVRHPLEFLAEHLA